jgi:hypothetical protein
MIGILIKLTNPSYSIVTQTFNIYVYEKNTQNVFYKKNNINGVVV